MTFRNLASPAVLLCAVAAGCGGEGDDRETVLAPYYRYYDALAAGDAKRACSQVTAEQQSALGGVSGSEPSPAGCERALQRTISRFDARRRATIRDNARALVRDARLEVDGDDACARRGSFAIAFAREDGRWRVAALGRSREAPDCDPREQPEK